MSRYRLLRRIAVGGMAEVFLARREGPGGFAHLVALKRILPHLADLPELRALFLAEARLHARLSHPHIVQVHDLDEDDRLVLALEYVPGHDVAALLRRSRLERRPVPAVAVLAVMTAAADALAAAHDLGVVHRDVTPANLLASSDGIVKLTDFGIATVAGRIAPIGKAAPGYLSPEEVEGSPVDGRADVWSLGVVAHELLACQRSTLPGLDEVVVAALARDPASRPRARELLAGLDEVARAEGLGPVRLRARLAGYLGDVLKDEPRARRTPSVATTAPLR